MLNALRLVNRRCFSYKSVRRPDLRSTSRKLIDPKAGPEGHHVQNKDPVNLTKQLKSRILSTGPIPLAEYMREVLTNPHAGYYMTRDVFGREGDFITSPEISQIFGELVGIWFVNEWRKLGSPSPFQLVELGPGRGTLARDILKVLTRFKLGAEFSMHMIEISPFLSKVQAERFCYTHDSISDSSQPYYQVGTTATGTKAYWHRCLEDVPEGFSLILAHEYFDALPIHKLQLVKGLWQEVLIDVAQSNDSADFRYILSKTQTPIARLFQPLPQESRTCLEYSLETERQIGLLSERIVRNGGIALIMDYGHFGEKTDTFRAFKQHALYDPLLLPGTADLTADVDFKLIKCTAEARGHVHCCGPVEQREFLQKMHGVARLEQLLIHALPENHNIIRSGYEMLTDPKQMGSRFKFFAIFPGVICEHLKKYPVAGFT